tara:strand:- start:8738 stop:14260 length:5523 start_codon:yes stop_codon:yes gene_type:complete
MADDSNLKKVVLEIGESIQKTRLFTNIEGYYETTEVGLGTFTTEYILSECLIGNLDGINEVWYDDPVLGPAIEAAGDCRNPISDFSFPKNFSKGHPHYVDFNIVDVETIGAINTNITPLIADNDGQLGTIPSNVNEYTTNTFQSDFGDYLGMVSGDDINKPWEFAPGPNSLLPNYVLGGNEDLSEAYIGGGKTIWKFTCEKSDGSKASFKSPGPRGEFDEFDSGGPIYEGVTSNNGDGSDTSFNPNDQNQSYLSGPSGGQINVGVVVMNENVSSVGWGCEESPSPFNCNDMELPYAQNTVERYRLGSESVQGRTLYLYPKANAVYKHPIIFDVFEGKNDSLWVRGSSKGIVHFISELIKRAVYEAEGAFGGVIDIGSQMAAFDTSDGIPLDGTFTYTFPQAIVDYWPSGVDVSVQGFFSTYKGFLSPYQHSGLFKYGEYATGDYNGGSSMIVYEEEPGVTNFDVGQMVFNPLATESGINNLDQDISPVHAIGSSIVPNDYDLYTSWVDTDYYTGMYGLNYSIQGSIVSPTYNQYRRLGWRSACWAAYNSGGIAHEWANNAGFSIEIDILSMTNCEVWVLTDYFTEAERIVLETLPNYMEEWPDNGETVEPAAPFVWLANGGDMGVGDNVQLSGLTTTDGDVGRQLMVARRLTSPGLTTTCCPRAYSPFSESSGSLNGGGENMTPESMQMHWKEIMTITGEAWIDYWTETIMGWVEVTPTEWVTEYIPGLGWITYEVPVNDSSWEANWSYQPVDGGNLTGWKNFDQPYIEYSEEPNTPASHWEFIHIEPIDKTQVARCEINSVKIYKAEFDYNITTTEDTEMVTDYIVTAEIETSETAARDVWTQLDILDNKSVPLSLNFAVGDLRDVTKRTAGYSKTFELPASSHNERVIGNLSGPGRHRDGTNVEWRKGRIKSGGVEVFSGFVRIEGYETASGGRYKCHIVEDPGGWPTLIGDKNVCDITIPVHDKKSSVIKRGYGSGMDSDNPGIYTDGINIEAAPPFGLPVVQRAYIYAPISYGPWNYDGSYINAQSLHPGIRVRYLLNKIFDGIDYKLESKWMDDAINQYNGEAPSWVGDHSLMSRLFIPFSTGEDYNNTEEAVGENGSYMVRAGRAELFGLANHYLNTNNPTAVSAGSGSTWYSSFPSFIEESDVMNCYNEANLNNLYQYEITTDPEVSGSGQYEVVMRGNKNGLPGGYNGGYTVPFSGRYKLLFKCEATHIIGDSWNFGICNNGPRLFASWMIKPAILQDTDLFAVFGGADNTFNLLGAIVPSLGDALWSGTEVAYDGGGSTSGSSLSSPFNSEQGNDWTVSGAINGEWGVKVRYEGDDDEDTFRTIVLDCEMDLQENDTIKMGFFGRNRCGEEHLWMIMRNCELLIYPTLDTPAPEFPVSLSTALGCDFKQMDLIKGVTEMFNLHWTADAENKIAYCEPYDNFYGSGKVIDWSDKLDMNTWEDKYIIDEAARNVIFKYASDTGDGLINDFEVLDENDPLWSIAFENTSIFNKVESKERGTKIFASTAQFLKNSDSNGDAMWPLTGQPDMPVMWKNRENVSGELPQWEWLTNTTRPSGQDGAYQKFKRRILVYFGHEPSSTFNIASSEEQSIIEEGFPYCGTQNYMIPIGKDYYSIAWEDRLATSVLDDNIVQENLGLFSKFWKRQYELQTGKGTLRICKIRLNDIDIELFDYRDIIKLYFDNVATYWTVNKIKDYKPGVDELTTVELVEYRFQKGQSTDVSIYKNQNISNIKTPDKLIKKESKSRIGPNQDIYRNKSKYANPLVKGGKPATGGGYKNKNTGGYGSAVTINQKGEVITPEDRPVLQAEINGLNGRTFSDIYYQDHRGDLKKLTI